MVLGTCPLLGVACLRYAFMLVLLLGIALSSHGSALRAPTQSGFPRYPIACVLESVRLECV
jgi:hypothetical protein